MSFAKGTIGLVLLYGYVAGVVFAGYFNGSVFRKLYLRGDAYPGWFVFNTIFWPIPLVRHGIRKFIKYQ